MIKLKNDIIEIGKRCWQKDFVGANDGNISIKFQNKIFATVTGVSKGFLKYDHIVTLDKNGNNIESNHKKPSMEIKMHIEVYNKRPDVHAVCHAHPPYATAFAVAGISLTDCVMPELLLTVGTVPIADYATPSTDEVPESISNLIEKHDAILLSNHGVLCLGKDIYDAYYKVERIEHYCKIVYLAKQLGNINYLTKDNIDKINHVRNKMDKNSDNIQCNIPDNVFCNVDIEKIKANVLKKLNNNE